MFNLNGYYKHLPLNERLVTVGLEQVIITYEAAYQFMEQCKDVLEQRCGKRFMYLTHSEFYQIPQIIEPMLGGKMFDNRTPFRNEIVNILNSIVQHSEDE